MRELPYIQTHPGVDDKCLGNPSAPLCAADRYVIWAIFLIVTVASCVSTYDVLLKTSDMEWPSVFGYDLLLLPDTLWQWRSIRHPFVSLFLSPYMLIPDGMLYYVGALLYGLVCGALVVMLMRVMESLSHAPSPYLVPLILFYLSFGHTEVLLFTPDTFFISVLALLVSIKLLWIDRIDNPVLDNLLMTLVAGVTVTNGLKIAVMFMFIQGSVTRGLVRTFRSLLLPALIFLPYVIFTLIPMTCDYGTVRAFPHLVIGDTLKYVNDLPLDNLPGALWEGFFCEPFVLHSGEFRAYPMFYGMGETYASPYVYIIPATILLLTVLAIVRHRHNPVVPMLLIWFAVDLAIPIFYGTAESYIFNGHWTFMIPVFLSLCLPSSPMSCRTMVRLCAGYALLIALSVGMLVVNVPLIAAFLG